MNCLADFHKFFFVFDGHSEKKVDKRERERLNFAQDHKNCFTFVNFLNVVL